MPKASRPANEKATRTYVLDTSVLLADPGALRRFEEHEVVLPVVVITELEGKRHHPELGYFARSALRMLDELRITHGRLDEPVPVGDLAEESAEWEDKVRAAGEQDAELGEYLRELEERAGDAGIQPLSGDEIASEFEKYLRRRGGGNAGPTAGLF